MPHLSGMTYGRAMKEKGRMREIRIMFMKDGVSRYELAYRIQFCLLI